MRVKAVPLALALMTSLAPLAEPADKTVWRVGVFDGSSGEFAGGEPHGAVHIVAGQDQPRTAWYAFAPVAWAGKPAYPTSAPRSIDFAIAGRAEPAYRLKVSLLIEHSSVPALRVAINGRLGMFYLHPRLDYNMGDMVAAFYPTYTRAEDAVDFPGSWLKTGTSSISFQAVPAGDRAFRMPGSNMTPSNCRKRIPFQPPSAHMRNRPSFFRNMVHPLTNDSTFSFGMVSVLVPGALSLPLQATLSASRSTPIRSSEKSVFPSRFQSSHPIPRPSLLWL
jgi:Polysaccharide lyase family 4, domain III